MRSPRWCMFAFISACAVAPSPRPVVPSETCAPRATAEAAVVAQIVEMYDALRADDLARFRAAVTPDFYSFDGGERFNGDALLTLIATAHAAGKRFEWTVQDPVVRVDCATALITYSNVGAAGDATAMQPRTWLESATLTHLDGRWRVSFFHATRVPPPKP